MYGYMANSGSMKPKPVLEPPRWPGGPEICEMHNLPAFETREDAEKFHDNQGSRNPIKRIGRCRYCGKWHYESKAR